MIPGKFLKAIVLLLALFNCVKWAAHLRQGGYNPLDYNTYYLSAKTCLAGGNMYSLEDRRRTLESSDSLMRQAFTRLDAHATPVYAPQFVAMFELFVLMGYGPSRYLYFTLSLLGLLAAVYWAVRLSGRIEFNWALTAVLAFRGTWFALDNGQPLLLCLAAIMASLHYGRNPRLAWLSGAILGLFAFKFTLIFAPLAYWFLQKNYKGIRACIFVSVLMNSAILMMQPTSLTDILNAWSQNINTIWQYVHVQGEFNGLNIINCSTSVVLSYYGWLPVSTIKLLFVFLFVSVFISTVALAYKRQDNSYSILLGLTLAGLCFSQHLMYDILVMLVYALTVYKKESELSWWLWPNLLVLGLPIGKLAELTALPDLNFSVPSVLLMNWGLWMWYHLSNKNNAIKKPN